MAAMLFASVPLPKLKEVYVCVYEAETTEFMLKVPRCLFFEIGERVGDLELVLRAM
jgi:hypothetical protein